MRLTHSLRCVRAVHFDDTCSTLSQHALVYSVTPVHATPPAVLSATGLIYPPDSAPTMMKMPKFQTPPAVTKAMQNARVYGTDAMDTAGVLWQKHKPETIVGYTVWLLSRSRTQLESQRITICSWHRRDWLEAACWDWRWFAHCSTLQLGCC